MTEAEDIWEMLRLPMSVPILAQRVTTPAKPKARQAPKRPAPSRRRVSDDDDEDDDDHEDDEEEESKPVRRLSRAASQKKPKYSELPSNCVLGALTGTE